MLSSKVQGKQGRKTVAKYCKSNKFSFTGRNQKKVALLFVLFLFFARNNVGGRYSVTIFVIMRNNYDVTVFYGNRVYTGLTELLDSPKTYVFLAQFSFLSEKLAHYWKPCGAHPAQPIHGFHNKGADTGSYFGLWSLVKTRKKRKNRVINEK